MLDKLNEALKTLPELLENIENWDSLIINRRKPHTYRVFTQLPNNLRLCLHKFNECDQHEAFLHPHPWPGAFMVMSGRYKMEVGHSISRTDMPDMVMQVVLPKWSQYEITNPMTWHSVTPLTTTYTIMVNGEPWDGNTAHRDVRTTKGKDLERMPTEELAEHLALFKHFLQEYNEGFARIYRGIP